MSSERIDPVTAGGLAYVDDRMDEARVHWESAFRELRDAGQIAVAARVAALLGELHWSGLGNPSIGRGWLERGRRLLEEAGPCVEWGYWELARLACDRPNTSEVERSARRALELAVEYGDVALQTRALADLGFALVSQGRLPSGFAHLEEALACVSSGELRDPWALSTTCCSLLSACDRAGDVERATEWLRIIRDLVLTPSGGRPRMLGAHCQLALGGVLCAVGQWSEAEAAVRVTLDRTTGSTASQRAQATARLAEMTIQQSRTDEAAQLLSPIEDTVEAAGPLAQLHLARGEPQLALAVLLRAIPVLGDDVLRRAELLALTVESGLAAGRSEEAALAAAQLRSLATQSEAPVVDGLADLADGLLAASDGRPEDAAFHLELARSAFTRTARPLMAARASLAFADIVDSSADAVAAARAAHAIAVRLGAVSVRDRSAAILRRYGVSSPRSTTPGTLPELTARESDILAGLRRGDTNAEIAAQLFLSPKTVEHHVSRVLTKLGVRTRAEAVAAAAAADSHR